MKSTRRAEPFDSDDDDDSGDSRERLRARHSQNFVLLCVAFAAGCLVTVAMVGGLMLMSGGWSSSPGGRRAPNLEDHIRWQDERLRQQMLEAQAAEARAKRDHGTTLREAFRKTAAEADAEDKARGIDVRPRDRAGNVIQ